MFLELASHSFQLRISPRMWHRPFRGKIGFAFWRPWTAQARIPNNVLLLIMASHYLFKFIVSLLVTMGCAVDQCRHHLCWQNQTLLLVPSPLFYCEAECHKSTILGLLTFNTVTGHYRATLNCTTIVLSITRCIDARRIAVPLGES
jgi:hypothetical protein